jgi:hypothetical protein
MNQNYNAPVPIFELQYAMKSLETIHPQTGGHICYKKYLYADPIWNNTVEFNSKEYWATKFIFVLLILESEEYHG